MATYKGDTGTSPKKAPGGSSALLLPRRTLGGRSRFGEKIWDNPYFWESLISLGSTIGIREGMLHDDDIRRR